MFQRNALAVLGLVGFAAMGCSKESTSSTNIKTGGIAARIDVYADTNTTARVHVELVVGGTSSNTYVNLEGGDKLVAKAGDESKTLTSTDTGVFDVTFSGVEAEEPISVSLERPADTTAPGNSGTLPPPFDVEKPEAGKSRKTDDLAVAWAPSGSGDPMDLDFSGSCIYSNDKSVSDTGAYTVKKGTLESTGGEMPETCDLTLDIQRTRKGVADSAFDPESYFRLHQRRSTSFTSLP